MIGKLGKLPAKHDPRTLRLENYLDAAVKLPPLPPKRDWNAAIKGKPPMFGNDKNGDCVVAGAARREMTWTANSGRQVVIPDQEVVNVYYDLTGGADTGLYLLDFLKWWRNHSIHDLATIGAFVAFDPHNWLSWRYVVEIFGGAYAGFALPIRAQKQIEAGHVWDVPHDPTDADNPGGWGGHCMNAGHFEDWGSKLDTWATWQPATKKWIGTYCDEAYALVSLDWFTKDHVTPTGIHWSELIKDLKAVTK